MTAATDLKGFADADWARWCRAMALRSYTGHAAARPSRRQRGWPPPSTEILILLPSLEDTGNRCTQISGLPDSSDTYATQRVSGENWT
jgi:hypothetical protein